MVYGEGKTFDVDRVIDLLQALEKFVAVRDTGDGTAYKVDGVRGGVYVGQAGDVRGTNRLDADGDAKARSALDAYRAEGVVGVTEGFSDVGLATAPAPSPPAAAPPPARSAEDKTASTTREALGFFFSDDGQVFRDFLVEEVVAAADALSREALQTLILTAPGQALDRLPQPAFVRSFNREVRDALAPKPNESDEKALSSILTLTLTLTLTRTRTRTLTLTLTLTPTPTLNPNPTPNPNPHPNQVLSSIRRLLDFFLDGGAGVTQEADQAAVLASSNSPAVLRSLLPDEAALARGRTFLPILREYQGEMRAFGLQIVGRLAELQTSRALGLVRSRIGTSTR